MTTQTETPVPEKFWPGPEEGTWCAFGVDVPETGWQCKNHRNDTWYMPVREGKRHTVWLERIVIVRPFLNSPRKHALADNTVTTTDEARRLDPETWEFASTDGSGWISVGNLALGFPDIPVVVRQRPAPATTDKAHQPIVSFTDPGSGRPTIFETPAAKLIKEFRDPVMTVWASRDGVYSLRHNSGGAHYTLQVRVDRPDDYNQVPVHVEVPHDLRGA